MSKLREEFTSSWTSLVWLLAFLTLSSLDQLLFSCFHALFLHISIVAAAKSLQSCPTLCDPIDDSPPGSAVPGILQAKTVEWVAISFSNAWKWKVKEKLLSRVRHSEGKTVYFISLSLGIVTWLWCALETKDSWPQEEIILRMDIESMSNLNQSNFSLF